jgi:ubiquinone/menaquinone biosynthesis C-methylase UbiE
MQELLKRSDLSGARMLHFAPESFLTSYFRSKMRTYETADLFSPGVDHRVDLCHLPFESGSYDLVYASHVLEHVQNDRAAIAEIRRILSPAGMAILPVPIVSPVTIEYPEPNPLESFHVRAPGEDYFERYTEVFTRVALRRSGAFPGKYQCYNYDCREPGVSGRPSKHEDIVPICFVGGGA